MNRKSIIGASLGLTCVVMAGAYFVTSNQNDNAKIIGNYTSVEPHSFEELAKGIEWGLGKKSFLMMQNQSFADEISFQNVRKELLVPLEKTVMTAGKHDLQSFFIKNGASVFGIDSVPTQLIDDRDGIKRFSWLKNVEGLTNHSAFNKYTQSFAQIEDFRIDVKSFHIDMIERNKSDATPMKMKLMGFFDLRGQALTSERRHDTGLVHVTANRSEGVWKIEEMSFHNGTTLVSNRAPAFQEVTSKVFAENTPAVHLRREAIRRGGYALALADINHDGFLDIYIGTQEGSEMMMFDPTTASYKKKIIEAFAKENMVKTGIFNDFDNDQDEDLFITTFNPNPGPDGLAEELVLYENDKGTFTKVTGKTKGMRKLDPYYPMPAVVGDFNNDGLSDVYVGFPGKKDFTFTNLVGNEVVGGNRAVQGLFLNKGELAFHDSELAFPTMATGTRQYLYPHSALAIDWNKDKKMDIVVIDDQDNLSPFYVNKGNAVFEQIAEKIGVADTTNAMSIAAGDYNNDGMIDFALTSVNVDAAGRYDFSMTNTWYFADENKVSGLTGSGLRLFQQNKNGTFTEVTVASGLTNAGQGGAGIEFIDYNNDGYADLYMTNGLWSGSDRYQDAGYLLAEHKIKNLNFTDNMLKDRTKYDTVSTFMSFLIDFRGDLFDSKFKGTHSPSVAGYQRNRLFRNNGDGTFVDMGYMEGVDSIHDGYVVATADLDKNGKMDLILRNGDPAQKEYLFPAVQMFHNNMSWEGNSINLALKNNKGVDAIGVGVTVEYEGMKQYKQMISNNGAAQSERSLHFGIGKRDNVAKLTIHWVSGDKVYTKIPAGRHEFTEVSSILSSK